MESLVLHKSFVTVAVICDNFQLDIVHAGFDYGIVRTKNASRRAFEIHNLNAYVNLCKSIAIDNDVGIVGDIVDSFTRIAKKCRQKSLPAWGKEVAAFREKQAEIEAAADACTGEMAPKKLFDIINR